MRIEGLVLKPVFFLTKETSILANQPRQAYNEKTDLKEIRCTY